MNRKRKQWGLKVGQQLDWSFEMCSDASGSGKISKKDKGCCWIVRINRFEVER
jgi:hypothetical protein